MTTVRRQKHDLTAELTPEQATLLHAWRADALTLMPYFSRILYSLRVVNAPGFGTFAVDDHHRLYIDFDAMAPRGSRFCAEALLHECGHLFQQHSVAAKELGVQTQAHRQTFNAAGDAAINDDLRDAGMCHVSDFGILPSSIAEPDYQTPHHYFRALMMLQGNKPEVETPERERTVIVTPSKVGVGDVKNTTFTAFGSPKFENAVTSVIVGDVNSPIALATETPDRNGRSFTTVDELPCGTYSVRLSDGTEEVTGTFEVEGASVSLTPEAIGRGWKAPYRMSAHGTFTHFDESTTVEIVHGTTGQKVLVANVEVTDPESVYFDLDAQAPNGLYVVTVTTPNTVTADGEPETAITTLPIGLPHMRIIPEELPVGFVAPFTMALGVRDFEFGSDVEFSLLVSTPLGPVALPDTTFDVSVRNANGADLTLNETLSAGRYVVVATDAGGESAYGQFLVSDGRHDDEGDAEGDAEGEGDGDQFKGCGSGSGGEAWEGELDEHDDLGGAADAASHIEKETILIGTAADIKDHVAKGRGTVPGGLVAIADKILAPSRTPWQRILAAAIRRAATKALGSRDLDYSRRHRRKHKATIMTANGPRRIVYPGYAARIPNIDIVRDTSGSMGAYDLAAVGREVEAVSRRLGLTPETLKVIDVDVDVHEPVPYRNARSIREVKGRGGTDMRNGINASVERGEAEVIVVITDGGTAWPEEPVGVPVIAAIVPQGEYDDDLVFADEVPDWITTVVVDPGRD